MGAQVGLQIYPSARDRGSFQSKEQNSSSNCSRNWVPVAHAYNLGYWEG
jgi:hypothetical protein